MKKIAFDDSWPESWKTSYAYDLLEIYGELSDRGYAYAYRNRQRRAIKAVRSVASPGARLLDLAAAQGNFSLLLAELGYQVTWNDLREELAGYVALKHETGVITYAPGNAFELEFDAAFDVVLMTEIIEHVAHPDEFLLKAAHLVKAGGHLVVTTPNGEYLRNPLPKFSECVDPERFESFQFKPNADGHIFLLHSDEINRLAQYAGLQVKSIELFTNPLTAGALGTRPLLRFLPRAVIAAVESITGSAMAAGWRRLKTHMLVVFQRPA